MADLHYLAAGTGIEMRADDYNTITFSKYTKVRP